MAYDKVVDSAVLNAGLTQIANAIREKAGTSDSLAFPAAMAEAILAIEAGGGGANIVAGTYTPASTQTSRVTVTHNLGTEPTGVIFAKQTSQINNNDTILFLWLTGNSAFRAQYYNGSFASSSISVSGANTQVHAQNHSNTDIVCGLTATTFQTPKNLYAGTYVWVVFGEVLK